MFPSLYSLQNINAVVAVDARVYPSHFPLKVQISCGVDIVLGPESGMTCTTRRCNFDCDSSDIQGRFDIFHVTCASAY